MLDEKEIRRREYIARLNRVADYIYANFGSDIDYDRLADMAHFSRFHFHRIWKAMTGETLGEFVRRIRLERAALYLSHNPKMNMTDIAYECGFSSSAHFSRAFKEHFSITPTDFRRGWYLAHSDRQELDSKEMQTIRNLEQALGNAWKDFGRVTRYFNPVNNQDRRYKVEMKSVTVKQMPELHVAYVRHIGPYNKIGDAFEKITRWAGARGFFEKEGTMVLSVYHDNPDVTPAEKLRSDACITVPKGTETDGEVSTRTIPGGKFAVARFELDVTEFSDAWDKFLKEWMPASGFQPDDRECYEICHNDPREHPEGKFIVDFVEPVKPL